ncbi:MAG: ATP synthase F1 subunit epsilon [Verrucomicrobia bacterium]|jgi:F-type H+-transporting ATPase subunit epsilon|nr:ATP synthase F1 subunit epsilon [Verrucomicrobiota bacterium]MBV9273949.1 ATP synthase F1 subunit epsilon [Verrucomicrobiota bacterium]
MATLKLEIVTPEGQAYADDVEMVVLPAAEGEIGIYPGHVPLMTQLLPGELRISKAGKTDELVVGAGFVEITAERVSVLTDMALGDEKINETAAEEAVERAQTALKDKTLSSDDAAELEAALARSMAQIRFKRRRQGGRH